MSEKTHLAIHIFNKLSRFSEKRSCTVKTATRYSELLHTAEKLGAESIVCIKTTDTFPRKCVSDFFIMSLKQVFDRSTPEEREDAFRKIVSEDLIDDIEIASCMKQIYLSEDGRLFGKDLSEFWRGGFKFYNALFGVMYCLFRNNPIFYEFRVHGMTFNMYPIVCEEILRIHRTSGFTEFT